MRSKFLFVAVLCLSVFFVLGNTSYAQQKDEAMEKLINENFSLATSQYKLLAKNTAADADVMPRNFIAKENKLVTSNTSWWTSGFFPGSLWYIYEYTKDSISNEWTVKTIISKFPFRISNI